MSKILLTEDDNFLRKVFATTLEEAGYEVITATNGNEALSIMQSDSPDLVLLDMLMPLTDGFGVLEQVQKDEKLKQIPIVALTNLEQEADREKALSLGAKGYCSKADKDMDELLASVKEFLPNS